MTRTTTADSAAAGRPAYHLTPRHGWINDPHGIVYRDGVYHVFTQWVPEDTVWKIGIHWGHATGSDLMSLRDNASVAIAPGDGDDGIWTGCIVEDGDRTLAFYTAVSNDDLGHGRIRVAEAEDRSLTLWRKGPVVVEPPTGVTAFRDPVVSRRDGLWWMTVGAELPGRAAALAWTSTDLERWTPAGVIAERSSAANTPWTGTLWECPQVFAVDKTRDAMITSVWSQDVSHDTAWAIGRWTNDTFRADAWSMLSYGGVHYAPSVFHDADGVPSVLFWIRGVIDPGHPETGVARWAGAHSVPYQVTHDDGRLRLRLHPDVYRHTGDAISNGTVNGAFRAEWDGADGDVLQLDTGSELITLRLTVDAVEIESEHRDLICIPRTGRAIDIVFDSPILEVLTDGGVGGIVLTRHTSSVTLITSTSRADAGSLNVRLLVP